MFNNATFESNPGERFDLIYNYNDRCYAEYKNITDVKISGSTISFIDEEDNHHIISGGTMCLNAK